MLEPDQYTALESNFRFFAMFTERVNGLLHQEPITLRRFRELTLVN